MPSGYSSPRVEGSIQARSGFGQCVEAGVVSSPAFQVLFLAIPPAGVGPDPGVLPRHLAEVANTTSFLLC